MRNNNKCEVCFYWNHKPSVDQPEFGTCELRPPVLVKDLFSGSFASAVNCVNWRQPTTHSTTRCGEFNPVEDDGK